MPKIPPKAYHRENNQTLYHGNMIQLVPELGRSFRFVFMDPPFNIGQEYIGYRDKRVDYTKFIEQSVETCWRACDGVLALHGNDDLCERYLGIASFLGMRRIAWVNWHYRFGQCINSNWIDARCHCLIYSAHEVHTWNATDVMVDSDRVAYGDKRIAQSPHGGKRVPGTVWGVPSDGPYWGRVQGNSQERRSNHPNQLPEVYMERLIKAYTNKGDRILDPFGGSGTTAVVAQALDRACSMVEISEENCQSIVQRLKKGAVRVA